MKKIIVIVVVLVLLVGGGLYLKNKNSSTKSNKAASSGSSSMANMPDSTHKTQSSTSEQPEATDAVTINNFAFSPSAITVKKGTTVTWTNEDSVAHTITETDGQDGPTSSSLDKGRSYTFTYNTVGTFKYNCSIHPEMTGSVTVTE